MERFRTAGAAADSPEETPTAEKIVAAVVIRPSVLPHSLEMRAVLVEYGQPAGLGFVGCATYFDRDADDDAY